MEPLIWLLLAALCGFQSVSAWILPRYDTCPRCEPIVIERGLEERSCPSAITVWSCPPTSTSLMSSPTSKTTTSTTSTTLISSSPSASSSSSGGGGGGEGSSSAPSSYISNSPPSSSAPSSSSPPSSTTDNTTTDTTTTTLASSSLSTPPSSSSSGSGGGGGGGGGGEGSSSLLSSSPPSSSPSSMALSSSAPPSSSPPSLTTDMTTTSIDITTTSTTLVSSAPFASPSSSSGGGGGGGGGGSSSLSSFTTDTTTTTSTTTTTTTSTTSTTTTNTNPYILTCSTGLPQFFNILVEEIGQPEQWLSEVTVPGGTYQGSYGYEKLPLTTSHGSAAVFSSNQYNNLVSTIEVGGVLTTVYAAVKGSAIGNTIVQLYQPSQFPVGAENYTISMANNCGLTISCFGANIEKVCAGSLALLTNRFSNARGSQCTSISLFVVPVIVPVSSSTKSTTTVRHTSTTSTTTTTAITTSTTTTTTTSALAVSSSAVPSVVSAASTSAASSSPVSSSTPVPSCVLPTYFTITVNETGMAPQYLYDPFSVDDEALSFTTDSSQGLIFSLNATGQLEFTISDIYNNVVQLISEQDIQNAGNEAVFFSTSTKFNDNDYQPVVATLNPDCSLSLSLAYDGATVLQVCEGTLFLMLSPSDSCANVELEMTPYEFPTSTSSAPASSSSPPT